MTKLKKVELELITNFIGLENKRFKKPPYLKAWNVWIKLDNGAYLLLGSVQKLEKIPKPNYEIKLHQLDLRLMMGYYIKKEGRIKFYHEGVTESMDKRKYRGYGTLKEAVKVLKTRFIENFYLLTK